MILLKKLYLTNFLSHVDTVISFKEHEQLLIDGVSGSGKSSIFDAIVFALYANGRADNRSLVKKGEAIASVTLVLFDTVKNEEVSITRVCTVKGKHTVNVLINNAPLGISGVKEVQQWIEKELIGASHLLFVNSVAYVQGGAEAFISQSPARRKEILLEIIKADNFDGYYDKAKKLLTEIEVMGESLKYQKTAIEEDIKELKAEIEVEDVLKEHKKNNEAVLLEIGGLKKEKEERIENLKQIKAKIESYGMALGALMENWEAKKTRVEDLEKKVNMKQKWEEIVASGDGLGDRKNALIRKIEVIKEEMREYEEYLRKRPADTDAILSGIKRKKTEVESYRKNAVCPSGDACPYYKNTLHVLGESEKELKEMEELAEKMQKEKEEWEKGLEKFCNKESGASLQMLENELMDVRMKIKEVQAGELELVAMSTLQDDYLAAVEARNELVVKIHDLKEERAKAEGDFKESDIILAQDDLTGIILKEKQANEILAKIKAELHQVQRAKEKKELKYKELDDIKKSISSLALKEVSCSMIKDAFGSKGIKAIAIDYLLPRLEDGINEVLRQLSDFSIHLDSQRASADGEGVVEGLFITITTGSGQTLPVESLSGGEKTKLIVAFSEALAALQRCGFRLLDESITALDPESLESFLEALRHLQKKYPQVLCISHVPEVKDIFDSSIRCVKRAGITSLEE